MAPVTNGKLSEPAIRLLARVGNLVMAWNALENWMRQHISRHTGNTWEAVLASMEGKGGPLTNRMAEAVKSLATDEARTHLLHFSDAFDRLRLHRNRIIHRLKTVMNRDEQAMALLYDVNRRGIAQEVVYDREIAMLVDQCWAFEEYARQMLLAFDDNGAVRSGVKTLPERPPLPPAFEESRQAVPVSGDRKMI